MVLSQSLESRETLTNKSKVIQKGNKDTSCFPFCLFIHKRKLHKGVDSRLKEKIQKRWGSDK